MRFRHRRTCLRSESFRRGRSVSRALRECVNHLQQWQLWSAPIVKITKSDGGFYPTKVGRGKKLQAPKTKEPPKTKLQIPRKFQTHDPKPEEGPTLRQSNSRSSAARAIADKT